MNSYERLCKLIENKITHFSQIDTSEPVKTEAEPDTISQPEFNKIKKVGRPKVNKVAPTITDVILKEYKKLENEYNMVLIDLKIAQKENEILRNEIELNKLQEIKSSLCNSMQSKKTHQ